MKQSFLFGSRMQNDLNVFKWLDSVWCCPVCIHSDILVDSRFRSCIFSSQLSGKQHNKVFLTLQCKCAELYRGIVYCWGGENSIYLIYNDLQ